MASKALGRLGDKNSPLKRSRRPKTFTLKNAALTRTAKWRLSVSLLSTQRFWNYILTLVLITFSISMINEYAARNSASELLTLRMNEAHARLATEAVVDQSAREKLRLTAETAQYLKGIVDTIIVSGYPPMRPQQQWSEEKEVLDKRVAEILQNLLDHSELPGKLLSGSSNMLIAFIAIVCCGIGASFASIRTASDAPLNATLKGFIAGFVVFLALKGGKTLLFSNPSETIHTMNPYNTALAALLVGIFTEKAYRG